MAHELDVAAARHSRVQDNLVRTFGGRTAAAGVAGGLGGRGDSGEDLVELGG